MKKHLGVIIVFFAVACHSLTCVVAALAQKNCTITQPLNSMNEGKFLSLLNCDPNTLFAEKTLSENDKKILLQKLADLSFFEEKVYVSS